MKRIIFKRISLIVILSWFAVLIWMIVIFTLSSQPAKVSDHLSKSIAKEIVTTGERIGVVEPGLRERANWLQAFNNQLRDYTHGAQNCKVKATHPHAAGQRSWSMWYSLRVWGMSP